MDPDQTSDLDLHCLLKRLQNVSADTKNIPLFVICALRVNTCKFSVYTVRIFINAPTFVRPKNLFQTLHHIIDPDFPSLADEIAESCPYMNLECPCAVVPSHKAYTDMNIKVTAFIVGKNIYYMR